MGPGPAPDPRVVLALEHERMRIARDLHDEFGQTLTAIALEAERGRDADGARIAEWANRALDELRRIGNDLRPSLLEECGLASALGSLCMRLERPGAPRLSRTLGPLGDELPHEVELVAYRVAQESLTNALRHAGARNVAIELRADGGVLRLRIADDGRGLPERVRRRGGLTGMHERAELVGGRLSISSQPGGGTVVGLEVPLGR